MADKLTYSVAPNPFNPSTSIAYSLPANAEVSLIIYDVRGHAIATLVTGPEKAGEHSITWDGRNSQGAPQPSGVYMAQIRAGKTVLTRKMTLVQ